MKTTVLSTFATVCVLAGAVGAGEPDAAGTAGTRHEKCYNGTTTSVDVDNHILHTRSFLLGREFNLGDQCVYAIPGKPAGTMSDLRPGQKVRIYYQKAHGVLVAEEVVLKPVRFTGKVVGLDRAQRTMTVRHRLLDMTFSIPSDCSVVMHHGKPGTLADVLPGEWVTVTYETPKDKLTAREIAQKGDNYTGTLEAIDLSDRTVKVKGLLETRRFSLADGCTIVINGKTSGNMRDLQPGEKVTVNYDELNGVGIADRIAALGMEHEAETAQMQR